MRKQVVVVAGLILAIGLALAFVAREGLMGTPSGESAGTEAVPSSNSTARAPASFPPMPLGSNAAGSGSVTTPIPGQGPRAKEIRDRLARLADPVQRKQMWEEWKENRRARAEAARQAANEPRRPPLRHPTNTEAEVRQSNLDALMQPEPPDVHAACDAMAGNERMSCIDEIDARIDAQRQHCNELEDSDQWVSCMNAADHLQISN